MRKTKVYRPRRGLHFSDDRGPRPTAYFVGSAAVTRTRPTVTKVNFKTRKTDSLTISGGVMKFGKGLSGVVSQPTRITTPPAGTLQSISISPDPAVVGK